MTNNDAPKCAWIASLVGYSTTGFTADSKYTQVNPGNIWYWFWRYLMNGELPPGQRVFCGLALPDYIANLYMAQDAASALSVSYGGMDTSSQIVAAILDAYPPPPATD